MKFSDVSYPCKVEKKTKNQQISNILSNFTSAQSKTLDSIPSNENFIT